MRIAVLGTGVVGCTLADRLDGLGHGVVMGTRDPERTLGRTEPDARGGAAFPDWLRAHPQISLASFQDAAEKGDLIVVATRGAVTLEALAAVSPEALGNKVVLDTSLPLVRHDPLPPTLSIGGEDSLAERVQAAFPQARVVKSLTTMAAALMVDPGRVPGDHVVFLSGDDTDARNDVGALLRQFGWREDSIIDLGELRTARATEQYSLLLFELARTFGSFDFNISLNRP